MTEQLKFHLEQKEELEACCRLLSNILEVLYKKNVVRRRVTHTHTHTYTHRHPHINTHTHTRIHTHTHTGIHT